MNLLLLLIVFTIFAPFGGVFLYAGRKRRVGSEAHCRKCNYLLHGLSSDRCPECGAILSPDRIVHGEPTRRWRYFFAGWITLLAVAALLFTGVISQLQDVNWYQYKPTHFVLRDLNSGNSIDEQKAWTELVRRDGLGSLSSQTRNTMVLFALNKQINPGFSLSSLITDVINYLGARCLAKDLPADQMKLFFEQSLQTTLTLRPLVVSGDRVPFMVAHNGHGPTNNQFWTRITTISIAIDGREKIERLGGSSSFSGMGGGSEGSSIRCPSPGKHHADLTVHVEIYSGQMDSSSASILQYQTDRTMTASFEVLSKQPPDLMHAIFDPKLAAVMNNALQPKDFHYVAANHMLEGMINFNNPPAGVAYSVFVRFGGKEYMVGDVTHFPPGGTGGYSVMNYCKNPVPAMVDVILRPSEAAAKGTVDIYSYWNQEMTFPNVPVAQR